MKGNIFTLIIIGLTLGIVSCKEDNNSLKNDFIRKGTEPIIVGKPLNFSYAIGSTDGSPIKAVEIVASYPGMENTGIDFYSIYAKPNTTKEEKVRIVKERITEGCSSKAYLIDTIAATIRYTYVVPEEARGKKIRFHFRSITNNYEAEIISPEYQVSNVDIFSNIEIKNKQFFSIEDIKIYSFDEINNQDIGNKIDFMYLYKEKMGSGWSFGHSIIAPSNDKEYADNEDIPDLAQNKTLIERRFWVDGQLKENSIQSVYVDELDLLNVSFDNSTSHAYGLNKDQGVVIKTSDNKYVAYLYINNIKKDGSMTFSMKRLKLK